MKRMKNLQIFAAMILCAVLLSQRAFTMVWASEVAKDVELGSEVVSSIPTGMIKLDDTHYWTNLDFDALYDLPLEKNADSQPMVTIFASDNDNDIKSIEYFVATEAFIEQMDLSEGLDAAIGDNWILAKNGENNITDVVTNIPLTEYGKTFVYAKITDATNNVTYLNSTGIVLCSQPSIPEDNRYYEISDSNNIIIPVELNGHYIEDVILMDSTGAVVSDFVIEENEEWAYKIHVENQKDTIEINHEYLKGLNVNETYSIEIKYVPLTDRCEGNGADIEAENSKVQLTILNYADWGNATTQSNEVVSYIDNLGKTSVAIESKNLDSNGILWLSESANGSQSWYGIDTSESEIELDVGSRFYVQWLSADEENYQEIYGLVDEQYKARIDENCSYIFRIGIEDKDGNKIEFEDPITTYVQIGEDWDKEELKAIYVSSETDEVVSVNYTEHMNLPMGVMELNHFSPYIIYNEISEEPEEVTPPVENETSEEAIPPVENESNATSPKTGDEGVGFIEVWCVFTLVGIGVVGVLYNKNKRYQSN